MLDFDPNDVRWNREGLPEDFLDEIRRRGGIYRLPRGGTFLGRYDQVAAVFQDPLTYHATLNFAGEPVSEEDLYLPEIDEPRHGQIRRIVNSFFSPRRARTFESDIERIAVELIAPILASGRGDLVESFTRHLPSRSVVRALGLLESDAEDLVRWSNDGVLAPRGAGAETLPIRIYLSKLVAERTAAAERPDDFLTRLIETTVGDRKLTAAEIVAQMQILLVAAVETTAKLLGNMFSILVRDPDLYARLRAHRELVPSMVEETLRFAPPAWAPYRITRRPVDLGDGIQLEVGELVRPGIGSANRDDSVFADPHRFSIDRPNQKDHLSFGCGPHVCPGAYLARLEGRIALDALLDHVSAMRPVPGFDYEPIPTVDVSRPVSLPVLLELA